MNGLEFTSGFQNSKMQVPPFGVWNTPEKEFEEAYFGSFPEEKLPDGVAEKVIGEDDRIQIKNTKAFPYQAICHLSIEAQNGKKYIGSAWFVDPNTLVTAGHCVFLHGAGGWAKSITVTPGLNGEEKPFGSFVSTNFVSVAGWVKDRNRSHDYAVIKLDSSQAAQRANLGWFQLEALSNESLKGKFLNICGFPGDKGGKTQWYHAREVERTDPKRIFYTIDTAGGMSGCPVFIKMPDGNRLAVAVHTTGNLTANSGTRITSQVLQNIMNWKKI